MTSDKKEPGFDPAEFERRFMEVNSTDEGIGRTAAKFVEVLMRASLTTGDARARISEASRTFADLNSLISIRLEQAQQKGERFYLYDALATATEFLSPRAEHGELNETATIREIAIQGAWLFLELSQGGGFAASRAGDRLSQLMRSCDELRKEREQRSRSTRG